MGLNFTVGGTRGTFTDPQAEAIAVALDRAFGAEGEWEGVDPVSFGQQGESGWSALQAQARAVMGPEMIPNLLALGGDGRGVYLPAPVHATSLPLKVGGNLRCASLPGLRAELEELAGRWQLSLEEPGLRAILDAYEPSGSDPAPVAFARLVLAANEAARRDCPLWVVGLDG